MTDLKAGEEVRVFDVFGRREGQPDGGWPGWITNIDRKYVTVEYGENRNRVDRFLIGTRRVNDGYGYRYFRTMGEVDD